MPEQLSVNMTFQKREWVWQRLGWALMLLITFAALLGLLGGAGPLNTAQWGDPSQGLWIEGRHIERHHRPANLKINIDPRLTPGGAFFLTIDRDYLHHMQATTITPTPTETRIVGPNLEMRFALTPLHTDPRTITIFLEPDDIGRSHATIAVRAESGEPRQVSINQLILP